jgi:hypothetical protein
MNCKELAPNLIEQARKRRDPSPALKDHLAHCAPCQRRWDVERQLTAHLNAIREQVGGIQPSSFQRARLMQEFSRRRKSPAVPSWAWGFAAAAAMLIAAFIGHEAALYSRHSVITPAGKGHGVAAHGIPADTGIMYEVSSDATALSTDDYFEVPYAPPLAPGEIVRVVHTQVQPEELANLGLAPEPAWSDNLPVDMVVGEDGLPRAVRISDAPF